MTKIRKQDFLYNARSIIEETSDAIHVVNLDGRLIYANKASEKIYGFSLAELQGKPVGFLNKDPNLAKRVIVPALKKTGHWSGELIAKHKSGKDVPVWLNSFLIKDEQGNAVAMGGIVRDVSERRKMDEEMARYINDLEFLADSANQFLRQISVGDPQFFIAKQLKALSGKSIVVTCENDSSQKKIIVRHVLGSKKDIEKLSNILGQNLEGMAFDTGKHKNRGWMRQGVLARVDGVYELSFKQFPHNICRRIEKELDLGEIYAMPFVLGKDLLGTVCILSHKGDMLVNRYLIEIFVNQASVALGHKRTEDELLKSEERYSLAQREASVGSWDWDVKTDQLQWSAQIEPMFGFKKGKFGATYKDFLNCVHPQDRRFVVKSVKDCIKKGKRYNIEHRIVWPDKTIHWVLETGNVIRDEKNQAVRMVGIVQDITVRKNIDEALELSEQKYRGLYNSIKDGIVRCDLEGRILECNQSYLAMLGYTEKELKRLSYQKLTPVRWHKMEKKIVDEQILLRGYSDEYEKEYIKRDGTIFPVSMRVWLIRDKNGPLGIWGVVRDITERKRIENSLRESEAKFRAVAQSANDAIISSDRSGKIISWNIGAQKIFGFSEEEAMGKLLTILMPEIYRKAHQKAITNFNPSGKTRLVGKTIEMQGQRKDGTIFPLELSLSVWEMGKKIFYTGIIRDITERKQLEQRKDEFISIASHELKTPLTSIKVFTQILQKRLLGSQDKQSLYVVSRLNNQVDRLTDLVVELLDMTRIQAGKMGLKKEWFSIDNLVREVVTDVQSGLETPHEVITQGRTRKMIEGDKYRIAQVISNLLANAISYSPNSNKVVVRLLSDTNKVSVSVQDFGLGIPQDKQKHVFERFYQVHTGEGGPKGRFSSLGLGLYISAEIVRRHGGKIWLVSEEGKGSTFSFSLPIKRKSKQ